MPARRTAALALLLPLSLSLSLLLPGWSVPTAAEEPSAPDAVAEPSNTSVRITSRQRVRLEALPQVVQYGAGVASPDAAKAAITATMKPVRVGRPVQLQVQDGTSWLAAGAARQDGRGRVQVAAVASSGGEPLTYRVRARRWGGLPAISSLPVSTERWLDATWTDEFSGTHLRDVWDHRGRDYVHSNRRSCSKGDPRAVQVADGALRLSVIRDPDATTTCRIGGRDATSGRFAYRLNGHVGTQGSFGFRYGFAAARVKFHRLRGQHGAFWLQPSDGMYPGALGSEIDVVEYFGDRHPQGGLASFTHRYDGRRRVSTGGWVPRSSSHLRSRRDGWSRNYHVFSVEWTPKTLVFRIDGKETVRMRGSISAVRQFPILSLIAADYEIPKIKARRLPQHMYVDWVRVWETGG
ncbi:glycoside hydrolase family 16 protein [Nocardioides glacieisoli]|uniref:Glycoside hydrolase family 16 protein n=1 Tax=Nocardioides glacieisoli TaxID=1168730 RepID=A0A4Q2RMW9_9ACTN|nr:glycoside hydrolase family 16 protein [Nocardioides glacieisoli]RYB88443.1 glycoside hydrolase family 16 protein [Nocardioides glacieisoli]